MSKHKALKILGVLSSQELKRFGSFLRKVYGGREPLIKLFDVLRKYHPDFDSPQLEHAILFRKIMPDKVFHEKRIFNEMSALRSVIEQFMIEEYLQENEHSRNVLLLQAYKKHQLDDLFFSRLKKMKKAMDKQAETPYNWLEKMKLAEAYYYHPSTKRITDEAPEFHQAMTHLDQFYAITKLQYACEAQNRQNVLQDSPKEIWLLEEIKSLQKFDNSPCFRCYALAHSLLADRADQTYRELKAYFQANFRKLASKDCLIIFSYLMNHVSYSVKKGIRAYDRESIDFYRFGLDHEILIIDGYFDIASFENIVAVFCTDKQYKWTSQFIKEWSDFLRPERRINVVTYCEAYNLFEQSKFNEAHQKINQNKTSDFHDDIRVNLLRIRCLVELEQYHSILDTACENFARITRRKKVISTATRKSVLNFLKIVRQFSKLRLNKTLLIKELNEMEYVFFRKWLLEKVQTL